MSVRIIADHGTIISRVHAPFVDGYLEDTCPDNIQEMFENYQQPSLLAGWEPYGSGGAGPVPATAIEGNSSPDAIIDRWGFIRRGTGQGPGCLLWRGCGLGFRVEALGFERLPMKAERGIWADVSTWSARCDPSKAVCRPRPSWPRRGPNARDALGPVSTRSHRSGCRAEVTWSLPQTVSSWLSWLSSSEDRASYVKQSDGRIYWIWRTMITVEQEFQVGMWWDSGRKSCKRLCI